MRESIIGTLTDKPKKEEIKTMDRKNTDDNGMDNIYASILNKSRISNEIIPRPYFLSAHILAMTKDDWDFIQSLSRSLSIWTTHSVLNIMYDVKLDNIIPGYIKKHYDDVKILNMTYGVERAQKYRHENVMVHTYKFDIHYDGNTISDLKFSIANRDDLQNTRLVNLIEKYSLKLILTMMICRCRDDIPSSLCDHRAESYIGVDFIKSYYDVLEDKKLVLDIDDTAMKDILWKNLYHTIFIKDEDVYDGISYTYLGISIPPVLKSIMSQFLTSNECTHIESLNVFSMYNLNNIDKANITHVLHVPQLKFICFYDETRSDFLKYHIEAIQKIITNVTYDNRIIRIPDSYSSGRRECMQNINSILDRNFSYMIPESIYKDIVELVRDNNFLHEHRSTATYERMKEILRDSYPKRLSNRVREDGFKRWQNTYESSK